MRFHANHVSVGEGGDQYFQVSFDSVYPGEDDLNRHGPEHTPSRLAFEITGPNRRRVEVTYAIDNAHFQEVQRIVRIVFGAPG